MFHVKPQGPARANVSRGTSAGREGYNRVVRENRDLMTRILCLGMSALDAIYRVPEIPSRPVKVLATGFSESGGGMAANASVAVSRLGGAAQYWGRVGDDPLGARILGELAAEGVDVTRVRRVSGCTSPSAAILVAPDGERLICAYNDPALDRDPGWLPLAEVAAFAAVLVDVRWPEGAARVLDAARAGGKPAVLDADVGPQSDLRDLCGLATHAVFSEAGLAVLSGGAPPGVALGRLAAECPAVLGVTLGADGFLWRDGSIERRVPAFRIAAIDTLAAGDVWHGAFTLALAEGAAVETAARFSHAAAALKCMREGGRRGAPTRQEVEEFLRTN